MLTRPSVLDERSSVGRLGCSCKDVTVSVCESMKERSGADVLRWSLGGVRFHVWAREIQRSYQTYTGDS